MATVVVTRKKRRSLSLMTLVTSGHGSPNPVTPPTHVSISDNGSSEHSFSQEKQQSPRARNLSFAHHRRSTSWPAVPLTENTGRRCLAEDPVITKNEILSVSTDNAARFGTLREKGYQSVDEKVSAMLAATASLKPAPTTPSPLFGSSVFIKVSSAFDRIYSKHPHSCGRASRNRFQKHVQNSPTSVPRQQFTNQEPQSEKSPLTTIEIRLNEGNNLNRKKVQRIVGGSVSRKPVPGHGQDLRTRLDDSTEQLQSRIDSSQNFDTTPISDDDVSDFSFQDPFTSEHNFEDGLTDGFLETRPAASSTPKSKISKDSSIVDDIQQTPFYGKQLLIYKDLDRDENTVDPKYTEKSAVTGDVFSEMQLKLLPKSLRNSVALQDAKRVKKHPSPSKHALEDLEAALTSYTRLRRQGNFDEVDELAADFNSNPTFLAPQDPNRLMGRSWERRVHQQHERDSSSLRNAAIVTGQVAGHGEVQAGAEDGISPSRALQVRARDRRASTLAFC